MPNYTCQYFSEVYLKYMMSRLYLEYGTIVCVIREAPTISEQATKASFASCGRTKSKTTDAKLSQVLLGHS